MTIGNSTLVACVNTAISTACVPLEILQLSSVSRDFDAGFVKSVANCAALPSASCNKGRLIYVSDVGDYSVSDGTAWSFDLSSNRPINAWTWGCNNAGQLGDNTTTSRSSPVSVVGGFLDWCQLCAGGCHGVALRTSGSAWAWGCNTQGQLGDNTTTDRSSPVSVVGGFSNWCQISAGGCHTAAVRTTGSAWAWGCNNYGQLGDNSIVAASSPVSVVGGFNDWCQISAGNAHTAALRTGGSAWAWGDNSFGGRLGDNTATCRSSPVSVVGGFTDWCQISAGSIHTAAVRTGGSAWAWGSNTLGKLGNNTVTNRSSPISVVGGFSDWCQISAGGSHTAAVRTSGSAWAWGFNPVGQLGDNTVTTRSSPVSVVGGFTNWCQISAGFSHIAAVRTSGSAHAWGCNSSGQLGDNTVISRSSPVLVAGGLNSWCNVSAGRASSFGFRDAP